MKRLGRLWPQVIDFSILYLAWRKARRGKSSRDEVAAFGLNLVRELLGLHFELDSGTYWPGAYRHFTPVRAQTAADLGSTLS